MVNHSTRAAVLIGVAVIGVAGCTKSVSTAELERTASETIEQASGTKVDQMECPDELAAKVGASVRCILTSEGKRYGVTVTVTSVENDTANYEFKVDEEELK